MHGCVRACVHAGVRVMVSQVAYILVPGQDNRVALNAKHTSTNSLITTPHSTNTFTSSTFPCSALMSTNAFDPESDQISDFKQNLDNSSLAMIQNVRYFIVTCRHELTHLKKTLHSVQ